MQNVLTDKSIRSIRPSDRTRRYYDGGGLYVEVPPSGSKYHRWKFSFNGKQKTLALGVFPTVSLKEAREKRDEAKRLLSRGIDPTAHRAVSKADARKQVETFEFIAREWHRTMGSDWVRGHSSKLIGRLEKHVFPHFGHLAIESISTAQVLQCMRRIEERGLCETAHRTLNVCTRVFAYAVVTGRMQSNPARELIRVLKPAKVRHYATITDPTKMGKLLRAIEGYEGSEVTRHALKLAPLLFVRPGELRHAEWSEFDLDAAEPEWHIPATKMKMRAKHIVPLARQTLAVLRSLQAFSGKERFLFPGVRSKQRPMSENTVNAALRNMGYTKEEMTGHGFRAMASTVLNERGFPPDAIERQLAHAERNSVRAAYCHAEFLPARREMMQAWANYLDELKEPPRE